MIFMIDIEHPEQRRVKQLFGSDALTTTSGMDWWVRGEIGGVDFDFSAGCGGFYENGRGQYFAGIPLRASVRMGDFMIVDESVVTSPYRYERTYYNPNIIRDYAPSPDPDFACSQALIALRAFSDHFPAIREKLAV
jgi:hypothetical protein